MQTKSIFKKVGHSSHIITNYYLWYDHSKLKNYQAMLNLTMPNSDFHQLTLDCKKGHQTGINYSYEFGELEIVDLSKTKNKAIVKGIIIMKMAGGDIVYHGNFISTCCKEKTSTDWKLNDIEIDWD